MDLWHGSLGEFVCLAESRALTGKLLGSFYSIYGQQPSTSETNSWMNSLQAVANALHDLRPADLFLRKRPSFRGADPDDHGVREPTSAYGVVGRLPGVGRPGGGHADDVAGHGDAPWVWGLKMSGVQAGGEGASVILVARFVQGWTVHEGDGMALAGVRPLQSRQLAVLKRGGESAWNPNSTHRGHVLPAQDPCRGDCP